MKMGRFKHDVGRSTMSMRTPSDPQANAYGRSSISWHADMDVICFFRSRGNMRGAQEIAKKLEQEMLG